MRKTATVVKFICRNIIMRVKVPEIYVSLNMSTTAITKQCSNLQSSVMTSGLGGATAVDLFRVFLPRTANTELPWKTPPTMSLNGADF